MQIAVCVRDNKRISTVETLRAMGIGNGNERKNVDLNVKVVQFVLIQLEGHAL
jgi:hypothetical protein